MRTSQQTPQQQRDGAHRRARPTSAGLGQFMRSPSWTMSEFSALLANAFDLHSEPADSASQNLARSLGSPASEDTSFLVMAEQPKEEKHRKQSSASLPLPPACSSADCSPAKKSRFLPAFFQHLGSFFHSQQHQDEIPPVAPSPRNAFELPTRGPDPEHTRGGNCRGTLSNLHSSWTRSCVDLTRSPPSDDTVGNLKSKIGSPKKQKRASAPASRVSVSANFNTTLASNSISNSSPSSPCDRLKHQPPPPLVLHRGAQGVYRKTSAATSVSASGSSVVSVSELTPSSPRTPKRLVRRPSHARHSAMTATTDTSGESSSAPSMPATPISTVFSIPSLSSSPSSPTSYYALTTPETSPTKSPIRRDFFPLSASPSSYPESYLGMHMHPYGPSIHEVKDEDEMDVYFDPFAKADVRVVPTCRGPSEREWLASPRPAPSPPSSPQKKVWRTQSKGPPHPRIVKSGSDPSGSFLSISPPKLSSVPSCSSVSLALGRAGPALGPPVQLAVPPAKRRQPITKRSSADLRQVVLKEEIFEQPSAASTMEDLAYGRHAWVNGRNVTVRGGGPASLSSASTSGSSSSSISGSGSASGEMYYSVPSVSRTSSSSDTSDASGSTESVLSALESTCPPASPPTSPARSRGGAAPSSFNAGKLHASIRSSLVASGLEGRHGGGKVRSGSPFPFERAQGEVQEREKHAEEGCCSRWSDDSEDEEGERKVVWMEE